MSEPQPIPYDEPIEGLGSLRGAMWCGSSHWTLLLHDLVEGADIDSWGHLPFALVASNQSVLAIDFPGYGLSDGESELNTAATAVRHALDTIQGENPATIFVVAAGSALSALIAHPAPPSLDALVALSPPSLSMDAPRLPPYPKLAIGSAVIPDDHQALESFLRRNQGWTLTSSFAIPERSHALLNGEQGGKIIDQIVTFLRPYQYHRSSLPLKRTRPRIRTAVDRSP
jgi:pimeloyl-ACP methyl ester carboxylesterase